MKNKHAFIVVLVIAPVVLAGCGSVSALLGGKSSPDEFSVYSRAPLSIPPEYKLRPPSPGAARPQAVEPRDNAKKEMLKSSQQVSSRNVLLRSGKSSSEKLGARSKAAAASISAGEKALVLHAGGSKTDPQIRAIVNSEALVPLAGSKALADKVLFWRNPRKQISIIDPGKENKRIREQQAKGKPVTSEGVPVIDKNIDRGMIDSFFFD